MVSFVTQVILHLNSITLQRSYEDGPSSQKKKEYKQKIERGEIRAPYDGTFPRDQFGCISVKALKRGDKKWRKWT